MIEIIPNLFIGSQKDFTTDLKRWDYVIHAFTLASKILSWCCVKTVTDPSRSI